jgi:pimeloyl-ACP methyl ester carboxylesterase
MTRRTGLAAAGVAVLLLDSATGCAARRPLLRIDAGGTRIACSRAGKGAPAVVFDSGLGDPMIVWSEVFPAVSSFTTALAWDRPGIGLSGPAVQERTSARIVEELHDLLVKLAIPPPWILVGHSFGGLNVQLFARTYPSETAGVILVEATHPAFRAAEERLRSPGEMVSLGTRFSKIGPAARAEFDSVPVSSTQVRRAGPFPKVPLVVITAGRHADPVPALERLWGELQQDLVRLNGRGRQVVANRSGHSVMYDEPDVVIRAIREMVDGARGLRAPGSS